MGTVTGTVTGTVRALYGHCRGSGKNSITIFFLPLCVGKVLLYIYSLSQLSSNSPNKKLKHTLAKKKVASGARVPTWTSSFKNDRGSGNHY